MGNLLILVKLIMNNVEDSTLSHFSSRCQPKSSGFSFDNIHRNTMIKKLLNDTSHHSNDKDNNKNADFVPLSRKTGTTVVGIVYKDGVIIGADTRETCDDVVVNKLCNKIHYLAPNIYCCAAGTSADVNKTTEVISSELELHRMNTGMDQLRVVIACTLLKRKLYRYQGYLGASVILGGCDLKGPHVYQVNQHGSTSKLPYTTMGSGALSALSIIETDWMEDMSEDSALNLVKHAITAGVINDLGSGSNVDTCIIRTDGTVTMDRSEMEMNNVKLFRDSILKSERLSFKNGTTSVLESVFIPHRVSTLDDVIVTSMDS